MSNQPHSRAFLAPTAFVFIFIAVLILCVPARNRCSHWPLQVAVATNDEALYSSHQGVICTMIKDETKYLMEWVQFHLMLGATKIVVYDDNSTSDIANLLRPFGERVVVHRVADLAGLPQHLTAPGLVHHGRQEWCMKHHCAPNYGGNGSGWLAVFDVDEFIFPCRNTGANLYDAFLQRIADNNTAAVRLECLKFGFNDLSRPLRAGELVTELSTAR